MSREERRNYRRMTRKQDPFAPPPLTAQARARAEAQQRARRTARRPRDEDRGGLPGRLLWWLIGGGLVAFLLGLSLAWPNGPGTALLIGVVAGVGWLILVGAFALWRKQAGGSQGARPATRR